MAAGSSKGAKGRLERAKGQTRGSSFGRGSSFYLLQRMSQVKK